MKRILLDENLPRQLKGELSEFTMMTVAEVGWAGIKNGRLLRLAETSFDVFVTADKNLTYQQPVKDVQLGVVILRARTTKLEDLLPLVPALRSRLNRVEVGEIHFIGPT